MAKKKKDEAIEKEEVKVVDEVTVEEVVEEKVEEVKEEPKVEEVVEEKPKAKKVKGKGKVVSFNNRYATYEDGSKVSITRAQHKVLVNGGSI